MAKQIIFTYNGKEYTLEYTRNTIKEMDNEGFSPNKIDDHPGTYLPMLIKGAFKAHHRFLKPEVIDEILTHIPNKESFIGKLVEMYNEPIMSMIEEPEESEGNVNWTASW